MLNSLVGRKVVSVSRTPGHTKYFQTYYLTPTVKLCDCPGLIFPSQVSKQLQVKQYTHKTKCTTCIRRFLRCDFWAVCMSDSGWYLPSVPAAGTLQLGGISV